MIKAKSIIFCFVICLIMASCATSGSYTYEEMQRSSVALKELEANIPANQICGIGFGFNPSLEIISVSSYARKLGLIQNDLIKAFDGESVYDGKDFMKQINQKRVNDIIQLTVERQGTPIEVEVKCRDGRKMHLQRLDIVSAASLGQWDQCRSKAYEFGREWGDHLWLSLMHLNCNEAKRMLYNRLPNLDDAQLSYDYRSGLIKEKANSPENIESIRSDIVKAISWMEQNKFTSFANELRSQWESAINKVTSQAKSAERSTLSEIKEISESNTGASNLEVKNNPMKGLSIDIETNLPANKVKYNDAFAVVIGNANYRNAKRVDFAVNDAQAVRQYLVNVLGFKEGNVFMISNASKSDFELYFGNEKTYQGKLNNAIKEGISDIFIYYSGHGAPGLKDKKGYFVPVEADPQYLELSGYSADVFYQNLSKVSARSITIVLDACFSGATIYEKISPLLLEIDNPVINLKNGVVLSSSTGAQISSWYDEKKHGMFTYFFLKAIHNKNADFNKNGSLTFDEIYQYISDKSDGVPYYARRLHGIEQNPTIEGQYKGKVFVEYK